MTKPDGIPIQPKVKESFGFSFSEAVRSAKDMEKVMAEMRDAFDGERVIRELMEHHEKYVWDVALSKIRVMLGRDPKTVEQDEHLNTLEDRNTTPWTYALRWDETVLISWQLSEGIPDELGRFRLYTYTI